MRKEKIKKKEDVCPIFDEEKRSELEKLGFRPVKQYNNKVKEKIRYYGYNPDEEKERLSNNRKKK